MKGTGEAVAHGAASILNAFATGKGAALSIDLWTRARVTLRNGPGEISGFVASDPRESSKLAVTVVQKVIEHYGYDQKLQGEVITSSNLPTAVGLKSSSAAASAVALAAASALDQEPNDDILVGIGVEASIGCGVSLTGAYDDSFASYHGGAVLTDNDRRKVERMLKVPQDIRIIALVPPRQTLTGSLDRDRFAPIRRISELAYLEASNGHLWDALTLNGLAVSSVLGEDARPALSAIQSGALGAGLSGKGPAIVAVVEEETSKRVRQAFEKFDGRIIETGPNFSRARVET
ncbi:MAG TPA: shikimate kinase [Candidatus Bathyarchaeia archaeon]|nr:shikimate kinase [Candidatus Bathyarchaeia archaeon]